MTVVEGWLLYIPVLLGIILLDRSGCTNEVASLQSGCSTVFLLYIHVIYLYSHRISELVPVLLCPNFGWYPSAATLGALLQLIKGVSILLGTRITSELLNIAESSLKDVCKYMEELYGM